MGVTLKGEDPVQLGVADTDLYTCPANTAARVIKCTACNDTTTVPTFDINKVPSGGAEGDDTLLINGKALGSEETYECPEVVGQILEAGDVISGVASAANQITVAISVVEIV